MLLPEVGGEMARIVEPTVEALQELGRKIASFEPETLVLISPHGPLLRDSMAIGLAPRAAGDFGAFEAPQVTLEATCDTELASAIQSACSRVAIQVTPVDALTGGDDGGSVYRLDHGSAVPLHFLLPIVGNVRVVLLGYSWQPRATQVAFGQRVRVACEATGRRVVYVASGDLSHRLIPTAPAGYAPEGKIFDEEVVAGLAAGDWDRIRNLPAQLVESAGVCGYHSILTLAGALGSEVDTRVLCYQGPFGVGYVVAEVEPQPAAPGASRIAESAQGVAAGTAAAAVDLRPVLAVEEAAPFGDQLLKLARSSLESYVRTGQAPRLSDSLPEAFRVQQACFVTLRVAGNLRGCVGTIEPVRETLAQEVLENAIGAGTRDYRFSAVEAAELASLAYSVDLLSPLEPVSDIAELDPAKYGMVVRQASRVGVLLPGIPEITDVALQFEVCCQKAGITSAESVEVFRFTVSRYAEPGAEH